MPRHIVEVHTFTHTCPADPQPHAVDTWRAPHRHHPNRRVHQPATGPHR